VVNVVGRGGAHEGRRQESCDRENEHPPHISSLE
jgi:hypothetical protein